MSNFLVLRSFSTIRFFHPKFEKHYRQILVVVNAKTELGHRYAHELVGCRGLEALEQFDACD